MSSKSDKCLASSITRVSSSNTGYPWSTTGGRGTVVPSLDNTNLITIRKFKLIAVIIGGLVLSISAVGNHHCADAFAISRSVLESSSSRKSSDIIEPELLTVDDLISNFREEFMTSSTETHQYRLPNSATNQNSVETSVQESVPEEYKTDLLPPFDSSEESNANKDLSSSPSHNSSKSNDEIVENNLDFRITSKEISADDNGNILDDISHSTSSKSSVRKESSIVSTPETNGVSSESFVYSTEIPDSEVTIPPLIEDSIPDLPVTNIGALAENVTATPVIETTTTKKPKKSKQSQFSNAFQRFVNWLTSFFQRQVDNKETITFTINNNPYNLVYDSLEENDTIAKNTTEILHPGYHVVHSQFPYPMNTENERDEDVLDVLSSEAEISHFMPPWIEEYFEELFEGPTLRINNSTEKEK